MTPTKMSNRPKAATLGSIRIVLVYILVSLLWIFLSDGAVGMITEDHELIMKLSMIKGWAFVFVTSLLLYGLIHRHTRVFQKSSELFREMFSHSPVAYQSLDNNGRFLHVNEEFTRMLGYEPGDILGTSFGDIWSPESALRFPEIFEELKKQGRAELDLRLLRKNGAPVDILLIARVQINENGDFVRIHCMLHDVTNRREIERVLRESEERYRLISENAGDVIWTLDPATLRFTYVSPSVERLRGFTAEEVYQQTIDQVIVPDSLQLVQKTLPERLAAFMAGDESAKNTTLEIVQACKDGSLVETEVVTTFVKDEQGTVSEIIGVSRDITERKKAEQRINYLTRLYATLSQVNQAIVRARDEHDLFWWIADVAQRFGDFATASVWTLDESRQKLTLETISGLTIGTEHPEFRVMDLNHELFAKGPVADVIRLNKLRFGEDLRKDFFDWIGDMGEHLGLRSWVILPFSKDGQIAGILGLAGTGRGFFGNEEIALFEEIGMDISYALDRIESERKRIQATTQLETETNRFEKVVKTVPGLICSFRRKPDGSMSMPYVSPAVEMIYGLTAEEIQSNILPFFSRIHPSDIQHVIDTIGESGATMMEWHDKFRYAHPVKGEIWIEGRSMPLAEPDGGMIWHGFVSDVTERKRHEEQQRLREQALRESQQIAGLGNYEFSITTGTWTNSEALDAIFGISESYERTIQGWLNLVVPEDREQMQTHLLNDVIASKGVFNREYRIVRHDNRAVRWMHGRGRLECDAQGSPVRMIGTIQDITERKKNEEVLLESEARYRSLIDNMSEGVLVVDNEDRIQFASSRLCGMLGYDPGEMVGRISYEFLVCEEDRSLILEKNRERLEGAVDQYELTMLKKNGNRILMLLNATPMRDASRTVVGSMATLLDITERKQMEKHLLRTQRMNSIGSLAGGIAHDLNNVLAPILLGLESIKKLIPESQHRLLIHMEQSARRGAEIIKQVLTFARGAEGERLVINPKNQLREMQNIIRETFPRSITLSSDIQSNLWNVKANATQLHQVLLNLCVNARDAMHLGGVLTIRASNVRIEKNMSGPINDAPAGSYVLISVSDVGVGISRDVVDKIFDPFFTTKEVGSGTGLGLSTVASIIKSHQGFIDVDSTPGKGSTFHVYFPAAVEEQPLTLSDQNESLQHGSGETILLVDDEPAIVAVAQTALEEHGYHVLLANDGAHAIAMVNQHGPSIRLIITDIMMPVLDGWKFIRACRNINETVPILVSTGAPNPADARFMRELRVTGLLPKPYSAGEICAAVAKELRTARVV